MQIFLYFCLRFHKQYEIIYDYGIGKKDYLRKE